ncbi:hypothetical protein NDU88_002156 [Pleurodeles waltl]|uniref:Uncharacterized protein n=1 Tax=Pleurodeles waltl TaxID=8319 RepID=A0AAV7KTY2_PLEWA|nr:hypothetical protein NDU88_002156 [Pleurodeles waltl]
MPSPRTCGPWGVYSRRSTHCRKRWEDLRLWARKTTEAQLGMASQRGRAARQNLTPLMARTLVVAYQELYGRLRAAQQPQGGEYNVCNNHLCCRHGILVVGFS